MRDGVLAALEFAQANIEQAEANLRIARAERDALIRQARAEGLSLRSIADVIGIHYTAVRKAAGEGDRR